MSAHLSGKTAECDKWKVSSTKSSPGIVIVGILKLLYLILINITVILTIALRAIVKVTKISNFTL